MEKLMEHKVFQAEIKEFDEKDLTVIHFISTEKRDRGGDILYADKNPNGKGMVMEGKPVVLFMHGLSAMGQEPIAKPVWIKKGEFKNRKGIQAKTQFFPDELGQRLWKKTVDGYLPNWSVGWRPMPGKYEIITEKGEEVRHVYEWELLEYSLVAVPMQPDAQTMSDRDKFDGQICFKMITEMEEKMGELIAWLKDDGTWEEKPMPGYHSCRLENPDKYIRIRYEKNKFGDGIDAVWGIQGGGKPVELQAIRFDKTKFTVAEARKWLKDHDYKCKLFEPASDKCEKCGKEMLIKWEMDVSGDNCQKTCEAEFSYVHDGNCEKEEIEPKRWNKSLSESFELDIGNRPPASWEYDLYRKFLKCEVKNIFLNSYTIPSPLLGSYLGAIKEISKRSKLLDTRNFSADGHESPPIREVIKLNSEKSDDFLIYGIQFFDHGGIPLILKFEPNWYGLCLNIITNQDESEFNKSLLEEIHLWVKQNNFLRGEKFALSGEFLDGTEDKWDDLILEDESKTIIRNAINQINKKQGEMKSRGLLFVGNPGTGKTKAGRTILNDCDATFLWVSSKDFRYGSSVGMISLAFSLAKDLSPSVIFMEDIDTWIGNYLEDLLKTEMDGLRQNKGIITILTSNNPERLPDALLDRPGRFHHVLDFKLPDAKHRLSMINLWINEEVDEKIISEIVKKTEGFSGAHLKELIDFAGIISEENGMSMGEAIQESLKRLMKQRELIEAIRQNLKSYTLPKINSDISELLDPDEKDDCCICDGEAVEKNGKQVCKICEKEKKANTVSKDGHLFYAIDSKAFAKLVNSSVEKMAGAILDEKLTEINSRIDALSAKPVTEKKKEKEGGKQEVNPPEPRKILIINTDEDKRKAEEDRKKQLSEMLGPVKIQIEEMIKRIPEIVKQELDRIRGKVN